MTKPRTSSMQTLTGAASSPKIIIAGHAVDAGAGPAAVALVLALVLALVFGGVGGFVVGGGDGGEVGFGGGAEGVLRGVPAVDVWLVGFDAGFDEGADYFEVAVGGCVLEFV